MRRIDEINDFTFKLKQIGSYLRHGKEDVDTEIARNQLSVKKAYQEIVAHFKGSSSQLGYNFYDIILTMLEATHWTPTAATAKDIGRLSQTFYKREKAEYEKEHPGNLSQDELVDRAKQKREAERQQDRQDRINQARQQAADSRRSKRENDDDQAAIKKHIEDDERRENEARKGSPPEHLFESAARALLFEDDYSSSVKSKIINAGLYFKELMEYFAKYRVQLPQDIADELFKIIGRDIRRGTAGGQSSNQDTANNRGRGLSPNDFEVDKEQSRKPNSDLAAMLVHSGAVKQSQAEEIAQLVNRGFDEKELYRKLSEMDLDPKAMQRVVAVLLSRR